MRLNKYIASATGLSRRAADDLIKSSKVTIDGQTAKLGQEVRPENTVQLTGKTLVVPGNHTTIILNKPVGYVCSRDGQGSKTIYDLLPKKYHSLKPVGRLDKDSSGLLLLTDDGQLANKLTHPRYQKEKVYRVILNKTLALADKKKLLTGVRLDDGLSKFINIKDCSNLEYEVSLAEGRNRQIRRSFDALGYEVTSLSRIKFGDFHLNSQPESAWSII